MPKLTNKKSYPDARTDGRIYPNYRKASLLKMGKIMFSEASLEALFIFFYINTFNNLTPMLGYRPNIILKLSFIDV